MTAMLTDDVFPSLFFLFVFDEPEMSMGGFGVIMNPHDSFFLSFWLWMWLRVYTYIFFTIN